MSQPHGQAAVDHRIAQLVVAALPQLSEQEVPGPLRPMVKWRRDRITRAAQTQILSHLASDQDFASSLAAQLVLTNPTAKALADDPDDPNLAATDPIVVAAILSIARPDGWEARVSALVDVPERPSRAEQVTAAQSEQSNRQRRQTERLKRQVDELTTTISDLKSAVREQSTRRKAETGQLSQQVSQLQRQLSEMSAALEHERAANRRLTKQLEQAQQSKQAVRRSQRQAEAAENARLAVLLAALSEAAAGLAVELQLPINVGQPADFVAALIPEPISKAAGLDSVAALQETLSAPQCHLIVDGYNVSKATWPSESLAVQRERLLRGLEYLAARWGTEVTVVFDGAAVSGVPAMSSKAVRVRFSEPGELADRVIVRLAAAEPMGRLVVVVSTDAAVAAGARAAGARTADSAALVPLLG